MWAPRVSVGAWGQVYPSVLRRLGSLTTSVMCNIKAKFWLAKRDKFPALETPNVASWKRPSGRNWAHREGSGEEGEFLFMLFMCLLWTSASARKTFSDERVCWFQIHLLLVDTNMCNFCLASLWVILRFLALNKVSSSSYFCENWNRYLNVATPCACCKNIFLL